MVQSLLENNTAFMQGQVMTVVVVPASDTASFCVNIGHDSDNYALHFNPRMATRSVVLNTLSSGAVWGAQRDFGESGNFKFPFQAGVESTMEFSFNKRHFTISLDDGTLMFFTKRQGDAEFRHVEFKGDGKVVSVKIKDEDQYIR